MVLQVVCLELALEMSIPWDALKRFCLFANWEEPFHILCWEIFRCGMSYDHNCVSHPLSAPLLQGEKC